MTLSETLLAAALVGLVLVVIALGMDGIRTDLKREQTIALLQTLDRSLVAYHQSTGQWPADEGGTGAAPRLPSEASSNGVGLDGGTSHRRASEVEDAALAVLDGKGSGDRVVAKLAGVPEARAVLQGVPEVLRVPLDIADVSSGELSWTVQDPWGQRLVCLTAANPSAMHRKAVAANNNRPIFVSAGPDGRFGLTDVSAASDDLRSDELTK